MTPNPFRLHVAALEDRDPPRWVPVGDNPHMLADGARSVLLKYTYIANVGGVEIKLVAYMAYNPVSNTIYYYDKESAASHAPDSR